MLALASASKNGRLTMYNLFEILFLTCHAEQNDKKPKYEFICALWVCIFSKALLEFVEKIYCCKALFKLCFKRLPGKNIPLRW